MNPILTTGTHPIPPRPAASASTALRALRDWFATPGGKIALAAVAYFAVYSAWIFSGTLPEYRSLVADILNIPLLASAALAARVASRTPELDDRVRRAWRFGSLALFCSTTGNAWWFISQNLLGYKPPIASIVDAVYLGAYPLMFAAMMSFPTASRTRAEVVTVTLDVSTVLLAGGAGIWYFILGPALKDPSLTTVETMFIVVYPVCDIVLLFASAFALMHRPAAAARYPLALVASAGIVFFLTDLTYGNSVLSDGGTYKSGSPVDLGWQLAALLCLLAALIQRFTASRTKSNHLEPTTYRAVSMLPYAAVAAGFVLLVKTALPVWSRSLAIAIGTVLVILLFVIARQIRALRETAKVVAERNAGEARFRSVVQHSSDVISIVDSKGILQFVSPAATRVFRWDAERLVGRDITTIIHPDDVPSACAFLATVAERRGDASSFICRLLDGDGRWRHVETMCTSLLHDPTVNGLVLNTRDVSDRTRLEAELIKRAYQDPLTGLSNRVRFQALTLEALRRPQRRDAQVAVIFVDLDNFKNINDSLGHLYGDRLLVEFSSRLLNATRGCDTVSRLGGDEFAVLLENMPREEDAIPVVERITGAMKKPFQLGGTEVVIGASIGIAYATEGVSAEELLRNADVAMYVAKRDGKGRYTIFQQEMQHAVRDYQELESDLRSAIEHNEFRLVFQPVVDLRTGRPVSAEALIRWDHPVRGRIFPQKFIGAAVESGLIVPIGRIVLQKACEQLARWRREHPHLSHLSLSVNVAGRQFQLDSFPAEVAAAIEEAGIPADRLILEITESEIMKETQATLTKLHAVKTQGVRIAIDDFGTGYSSLAYLQRFPVDILKIDKSFVDQVAFPGHGQSLARMIIALGDTLGMRTIAEGIQDAEQATALRGMRCELAQGYYFSAPVDADQFLQRLLDGTPPAVPTVPRIDSWRELARLGPELLALQ
jgi:diguanylate cyclase (GGDEF)-like protein/PAS domain S-box-containing protein